MVETKDEGTRSIPSWGADAALTSDALTTSSSFRMYANPDHGVPCRQVNALGVDHLQDNECKKSDRCWTLTLTRKVGGETCAISFHSIKFASTQAVQLDLNIVT